MEVFPKRQLHICKFIEYKSFGVHKISKYNEFACSKVAVTRTDGSLEVWEYLSKIEYWRKNFNICGSPNYLIESLFWNRCGDLITGDTNGAITRWNFFNIFNNQSVDNRHGPVIGMDYCVRNNSLIVACSDTVDQYCSSNLEHIQSFNLIINKIVAVAYHESGEYFVISSHDSKIHIYSVSNKICQSINISPSSISKCIGWSLLFLSNFVVVVGDSKGQVQFWEGITGTSIQVIKCHKNDTLSLCTNYNENLIVSSSVDKTLSVLTMSNKQWLFNKIHGKHFNDVSSVVINHATNTLLSGGHDGLLCHFSLNETTLNYLTSFGLVNNFSKFFTSKAEHLLGYFECDRVEIWQLNENNEFRKLIEITNKNFSHVQTGTMSPCGNFIAYSTRDQFFVYNLIFNQSNCSYCVKKLNFGNFNCGFIEAKFNSDSSRLYHITPDHRVKCVMLSNEILVDYQLPSNDCGKCEIMLGDNFGLLLVYGSLFQIFFIDYQNNSVTNICNMSRIIICASIDPRSNILYLISGDGHLLHFGLDEESEIFKYTINDFKRKNSQYMRMFYDHYKSRLFLYDLNGIHFMELNDLYTQPGVQKQRKVSKISLRPTNNSGNNLYSDVFDDGSIILVQRNLKDIYSSTHNPVLLKRFMQS